MELLTLEEVDKIRLIWVDMPKLPKGEGWCWVEYTEGNIEPDYFNGKYFDYHTEVRRWAKLGLPEPYKKEQDGK